MDDIDIDKEILEVQENIVSEFSLSIIKKKLKNIDKYSDINNIEIIDNSGKLTKISILIEDFKSWIDTNGDISNISYDLINLIYIINQIMINKRKQLNYVFVDVLSGITKLKMIIDKLYKIIKKIKSENDELKQKISDLENNTILSSVHKEDSNINKKNKKFIKKIDVDVDLGE